MSRIVSLVCCLVPPASFFSRVCRINPVRVASELVHLSAQVCKYFRSCWFVRW